jgi:P-aminobenzoate N-oxygenase AurF
MQIQYDYSSTLSASERIGWRIEDVLPEGQSLDFSKPLLPEALARVTSLGFLDAEEQLVVNHIRGNGYLCTFGLVEEFVLPFVLDHVRPHLDGDDYRTRALLQFACEEAKHIQLFKRFSSAFEAGFGSKCEVIGPPSAVAGKVLSHHPLAVALVTLHLEWMTQRHYVESIRDNREIDPLFMSLLKHHWMEEAQHAKIDMLIVEALAAQCSREEAEQAAEEYLEIGAFLDSGVQQQTELDIDSLECATGRTLSLAERETYISVQRQALRWTYLGSGMTHPKFQAMFRQVAPMTAAKVEQMAPAFC